MVIERSCAGEIITDSRAPAVQMDRRSCAGEIICEEGEIIKERRGPAAQMDRSAGAATELPQLLVRARSSQAQHSKCAVYTILKCSLQCEGSFRGLDDEKKIKTKLSCEAPSVKAEDVFCEMLPRKDCGRAKEPWRVCGNALCCCERIFECRLGILLLSPFSLPRPCSSSRAEREVAAQCRKASDEGIAFAGGGYVLLRR